MSRRKKKKWPWVALPSPSRAFVARNGDVAGVFGPPSPSPRVQHTVEKRPPSLKSKGRVALVRAPWVSWIPGVEPLHSLASSSAQAHPLDASSSLSADDRHKRELGFPSDLIGSHFFPHFVVFLSRLWSLPASSCSSYRGGWYSSSLHPPMVDEEWSRLGRCSMSSLMDQKNRNPNWDRWG
jgi:hypothetical protein